MDKRQMQLESESSLVCFMGAKVALALARTLSFLIKKQEFNGRILPIPVAK